MKAILLSLTAAGLSLALGLTTAAAGEPIVYSADPHCNLPCCKSKPRCCPQKCCKVECQKCEICPEKICKPEPIQIEVPIVSYACKCEDYCLTKCPPLPKLNLSCNKCGHCGPVCEAPCKVCQECDKPRKRNVLIKRIRICKEDSYKCVPVKNPHCDIKLGEKLEMPGDTEAGDIQ